MGTWSQLPDIVHFYRLLHGNELSGPKSAELVYESGDLAGMTFSSGETDVPHIFFV